MKYQKNKHGPNENKTALNSNTVFYPEMELVVTKYQSEKDLFTAKLQNSPSLRGNVSRVRQFTVHSELKNKFQTTLRKETKNQISNLATFISTDSRGRSVSLGTVYAFYEEKIVKCTASKKIQLSVSLSGKTIKNHSFYSNFSK